MYPFSQTPLPSRLPHNTEQSSICYIPYNRSLLVIHFKYSSVYVSISNSPTIPSLHPSPPATVSSFSKSVNLFMFCKFICLPFPFFQFVSVCRSDVGLLSCFCIHPVSLCLMVDAFNLFTFKVISDMYGEGNGPYSSTLAWKIPWIEEPGGLPSMGSHRVRHDWSDAAAAAATATSFCICLL